MSEKSGRVLEAQTRMINCLLNGNRTLAHWWARVARDRRQEDRQPEPFYREMEGVWWETRHANW